MNWLSIREKKILVENSIVFLNCIIPQSGFLKFQLDREDAQRIFSEINILLGNSTTLKDDSLHISTITLYSHSL